MRRSMTPDEKKRFKGYFPRLDVNRAVVTGNATRQYNCISWTIGVTTSWIWPGNHIFNFDSFYKRYGFLRSSSGPIAAWGLSKASMTHGSISGPGHGPRWESKCGSDLRIEHGLNELVGATYGRVVAFYSPRKRFASEVVAGEFKAMKLDKTSMTLLEKSKSSINKKVQDKFETGFNAWKLVWSKPEFQHLSDPGFVRYCKEFQDLVSLGEVILPLLIEKLTDPDNFFALQLYDALQPDENLVVSIDPEADEIAEGEQGRARKAVESWLKSN